MLWNRSKTPASNPLDQPLLYFTEQDYWTMRDSFSGTLITGATGSGKTSGSGQSLALAFLHSGMGGLVLTAKDDECDTWLDYARRTGRDGSVVVIDDSAKYRFNFMQYEAKMTPNHAVLTESLIGLFSDLMESIDSQSGSRDQYWTQARNQLLRNAIDLSLLSTGSVDLETIDQLIIEAPKSVEELHHDDVASRHLTMNALVLANNRLDELDEVQRRNLQMCNNYWMNEYPSLADRTRSSIVSTFRATSDMLSRGLLWQLFSTTTNIVPDMSREGVIFIINLPVKEKTETGIIAQVLFKFMWQRAMERRYQGQGESRPVFLWVDEYQNFAVTSDAMFQATARSKEIATVYLFQNLHNLYLAMGGDQAEHAVGSVLGNLCTHIFHANSDNKTNQWAAEKIAQTLQRRSSHTAGRSHDDGGTSSITSNEQRDFQVPPHTFTTLRNGGPRNNLEVDAIIFQTARLWQATDANFTFASFPQVTK